MLTFIEVVQEMKVIFNLYIILVLYKIYQVSYYKLYLMQISYTVSLYVLLYNTAKK
jgi:hypothetical protein